MPQMSPMFWLYLYIYNLILMMMIMIIMNFMILFKTNYLKEKIHKYHYKWFW